MLGRFLVVLALACSGCASLPPFDAKVDCNKISFCGPCASRGGCVWCGAADESGSGSCQPATALGPVCAAPQTLFPTPDRCPLPPKSADHASTPAATPAHGGETYGRIHSNLSQHYPLALRTKNGLDKFAQRLLYRGSGPNNDGSHREVAPISTRVVESEHRLYLGDAIHYRKKAMPPAATPMLSEFMMTLPMVRVALPQKLLPNNTKIETALGIVDLSRDHLLGSIDLIAEKYGGAEYLGYRPARVELITPARLHGTRFGAIAVYIGFRTPEDRGPSFYLLEAGTANGEAKMIYFSPSLRPIERTASYYLPTPFVSMRNTYSGELAMHAAPHEDEPRRLIVRSYAEGAAEPYHQVTVQYRRASWLDRPETLQLIIAAGARVGLIGHLMGLANIVDLEPFLVNLARNLHWREYPHYEPSQATPPSPAPAAQP